MIKRRRFAVHVVMLTHLMAASAFAYGAEKRYSVGDNLLKMTLTLRNASVVHAEFETDGRPYADLASALWSLKTDSGELSIADSAKVAVSKTGDGAIVLSGRAREMNWSARCESIARDGHRYRSAETGEAGPCQTGLFVQRPQRRKAKCSQDALAGSCRILPRRPRRVVRFLGLSVFKDRRARRRDRDILPTAHKTPSGTGICLPLLYRGRYPPHRPKTIRLL